MSAHAEHDDEHAEGEHDQDHADQHAAQPLDEPATPLWLTILGVGLFLTAGIFFVVTRDDAKTTAELTAAPNGAAPAASAAPAGSPEPPSPAALDAARAQPTRPMPPPGAGAPPPGGAAQPARRPGSQQPGHEGHDHE
jgi:hypothetical protein